MCGLVAIYAYQPEAPPVERDEVVAIRDAMTPRGPDGAGLWISSDDRVGLGHRRLSIIDLSPEAAQPMHGGDPALALVYNGEIYNYRALRAALRDHGVTLRTRSDTEVILALYAELGDGLWSRLRGMYALALWDAGRGAMLLGRDPYGIKPLYYADDGHTLRVASQVKALQAGGKVGRALDPAGSVGFLLFGSVPEPFTCCRQVRALPAGTSLWVDEAGPHRPRPFFSIGDAFRRAAAAPRTLAGERLQERVRSALRDSVRHHQVADVPVGAFLSSGVDSGALVGLMADEQSAAVHTVTVGFEEFRGTAADEAPLAEQVAQRYGASHHHRLVTEAELRDDLPAIVGAMDQPSIDGVNTWFVSKAAHEAGLKVAISGLGGDELFGGYPSFRQVPWSSRLLRPIRHSRRLAMVSRRLGARALLATSLSPKLAGVLEYGGSIEGAYLLRRGLFMPWELSELLPADEVRAGLEDLDPLGFIAELLHPAPATAYGQIALLESTLYMRNQLLRDTDWASMAHGLEVRTPLCDVELLQALAPLLCGSRRQAAKQLLGRSPCWPLPAAVLERPKTGFGTPVGRWLERMQGSDGPLDAWRSNRALARPGCHVSRRLAFSLLAVWSS